MPTGQHDVMQLEFVFAFIYTSPYIYTYNAEKARLMGSACHASKSMVCSMGSASGIPQILFLDIVSERELDVLQTHKAIISVQIYSRNYSNEHPNHHIMSLVKLLLHVGIF